MRNTPLKIAKEGAWTLGGQVLAVLGTLVSVRILTEHLNPQAYGELSLAMTLALLVSQTTFGPLGNGVSRFYSIAEKQGQLPSYLQAALALSRKTLAFAATLCMAASVGVWMVFGMQWMQLLLATSAYALVTGLNSVAIGVYNASRQRAVVATLQASEPILRVAFLLVLIAIWRPSSMVGMSGYLIAALVVLAAQFGRFYRIKYLHHQRSSSSHVLENDILAYSWPFLLWGAFTWLQQSTDRWFLGTFGTHGDIGQYTVALQLGYAPMVILSTIGTQLLSPILFEIAGRAEHRSQRRSIRRNHDLATIATLSLTALATLVGVLVQDWIIRLMAGPQYREAASYLPLAIASGGFFAWGQMGALALMSAMKTKALLNIKVGSALAGVAMNYVGARWGGPLGLLAANLAFSLGYALWIHIYLIGSVSFKIAPHHEKHA